MNDPKDKRNTGKEYGSGRNKIIDPRDDEKTFKFDLDDFLDEPVEDDIDDDLTVEEISKQMDNG